MMNFEEETDTRTAAGADATTDALMNRFYVNMMRTLPVAILQHADNGRGDVAGLSLLFANEEARRIYAIDSDVETFDDFALIHPDDREYAGNVIASVHETGEPQSFSHRLLLDDGNIIWIEGTLMRLRDAQGQLIYQHVFSDVTARKLVEQKITNDRATLVTRFEDELSYLNAMSDGYLCTMRINVDEDRIERVTDTSHLSPVRAGMTPLDAADALADAVPDAEMSAKLREGLSSHHMRSAYDEGQTTYSLLAHMSLPMHGMCWVEVQVMLQVHPTTKHLIAFVTEKDVSREQDTSQLIDKIADQDYDVICRLDAKSGIMTINTSQSAAAREHRAETTAEGKYEAICTRFIEDQVVEQEHSRIWQLLSLSTVLDELDKQLVYQFICTTTDFDGTTRKMNLRFSYIDRTDGLILATRQDVTALVRNEELNRRRLEEALEQAEDANNAKSDFLARMSHDLRTPMNAILGATALIEDRPDDVDSIRTCTDQINLASNIMLDLVDDILDTAKIERGELTLDPEPYSYEDFIGMMSIMARPLAEEHGVNFDIEGDGEGVKVLADRVRFNQIFINLISNAIKFTPEGGHVKLCSRVKENDGDRATLSFDVIDDGMGMSEDFQHHLFEPFTREASDVIEHEAQGTGLGLSIVKRVVDEMNGTIEVQSEPGKGTTFHVELCFPVCHGETPAHASKGDAEERIALDEKRILVVEDHPLNMQIMQNLLTRRGAQVVEAANGREALDTWSATPEGYFDAVLMDIRMPGMDGFEATRAIRALGTSSAETIPIIAMTGNAFEKDVKSSLDAGMNAHLAKPIDPDTLYATLAKLIDERPVL